MPRRSSLPTLLLAGLALVSGSAGGQGLLGPAAPRPLPPTAVGLEAWQVDVDPTSLATAFALVLDLPGSGPLALQREELEARARGELTWRGRVEGGGTATLTLHAGHLAGLLFSPDGVWELSPLAGGGHRLERIDQDRYPECGGAPGEPEPALAAGEAAAAGPLVTVAVLVTYTAQTRDAAGGRLAIETVAQAAVDAANTSFRESDMGLRFTLVGTALSPRSDSGDMGADLSWLAGDPTTAALRDAVGADLVSLVVESGQYCGIGYLGPGAGAVWQVTARGCAVGNLSWAHEHGHNLGMHHDPANAGAPGSLVHPWAYGHFVSTSPPPAGGNFRTVMSYSSQCAYGCTRVARFSNPGILYNGTPTGLDDGVCDPATWNPGNPNAWACRDNHRTGDLTGPTVAAFRPPAPLLFADPFETGTLAAWGFVSP